MRFYNRQHRHYCGIDLHVKTMYVCILDATGQVLVHRNVPSTPEAFLEVVAPYRDDLVVAAECMFTWYWLADVCAAEGIPFVLGHALAMKAIHGGKAKNDKIDSHKIASLAARRHAAAGLRLPGGDAVDARSAPSAAASGAEARPAPGAHSEHARPVQPARPSGDGSPIPPIATGVARAFPDPSVRKSIDGRPRARRRSTTRSITDLELTIVREAKRHDADAFHRLALGAGHRQGPGADDPVRDPRHHALRSRPGVCLLRAAGQSARSSRAARRSAPAARRWGTSISSGRSPKRPCCSCAIPKDGKKLLATIEKKHGKGKALSILAHKIGRAVFYMLSRGTVFSMEKFLAA